MQRLDGPDGGMQRLGGPGKRKEQMMDPITIQSQGQTIQFTNREIIIDGTPYAYGNMTQMWHVPQKSVYAVQCNGVMVALPYEEKDAQKMQILLQRVADSLHLTIGEYHPRQEQAAPETPAEETGMQPHPAEPKGSAGGILRDRRFIIEMVIGIALIMFGVIGFILRG